MEILRITSIRDITEFDYNGFDKDVGMYYMYTGFPAIKTFVISGNHKIIISDIGIVYVIPISVFDEYLYMKLKDTQDVQLFLTKKGICELYDSNYGNNLVKADIAVTDTIRMIPLPIIRNIPFIFTRIHLNRK